MRGAVVVCGARGGDGVRVAGGVLGAEVGVVFGARAGKLVKAGDFALPEVHPANSSANAPTAIARIRISPL